MRRPFKMESRKPLSQEGMNSGDDTTFDLVDKIIVLFCFVADGADVTGHTTVLTEPPVCFLCVVEVRMLGDGFTVGYTRWRGDDLSLVFTLHSLNVYIQVKFTLTSNDGFIRLFIL